MKGVMGPVLITGVVVAIGNGWILAAWNAIYTWTHTGSTTAPGTAPGTAPVKSLIGGANMAGLGKGSGNTPAQNIIPGNDQTNPNLA